MLLVLHCYIEIPTIFRLYEHFKKQFIRDFDNFYLISFKVIFTLIYTCIAYVVIPNCITSQDHLLLDAPLYNVSQPPQLSVIIPTISGMYDGVNVNTLSKVNGRVSRRKCMSVHAREQS